MKTICANRFGVSPLITALALTKSGLLWHIPLAQHQALEVLALMGQEFSLTATVSALRGIPATIDDDLPADIIELRLGDRVLVRIESLAIPVGTE